MPPETNASVQAVESEAAPGSRGRFGFGENWASYLAGIDENRINAATAGLALLIGRDSLRGIRMLDIGSGSGIHSLAAVRLGAQVTSFDFDTESVTCTAALRERFAGDGASRWHVRGQGSILDRDFVASLGQFDLVYSWGVLHHTGNMHHAIAAAASCVAPLGQLVLALYNDQGWISRYWKLVKRTYNLGPVGRAAMTAGHLPYLAARYAVRALAGKGELERGMSLWHDYVDWLGGYPFEVASPVAVATSLAPLGFAPVRVRSVGRRQGCNEFVFVRRHDG